MRSVRYRFLGLGLIVSVSLAACMDGSNTSSSGGGATASRGGQVVERDVEDASVFSKREPALWDGRPSLGGAWVAHPDAQSPERVIIRNTANGQETIGALFRRERMNPGPAFQVSAEAANAIGILAGAPTEIEVIALRSEDIDTGGPASAEPTADAPSAQGSAPTEMAQTSSPDQAEASEQPMVTTQARPQQEQPRGGFLGRLFGRNTPAEPEIQGIETQALDEPIAQAAAPTQTQAPTAAQAPAAAEAPPPTQQAQAQSASTLERPFIQLGIFSVEANAGNAETMARNAGLTARVVEGRTQGNAFWRVVIGPAQTQAEQSQMLARVKSLGFNDAYTVRR